MDISLECGASLFFLVGVDARNKIVFRDEALSMQKLKFAFVDPFWLETNLFLEDVPMTLVQFCFL